MPRPKDTDYTGTLTMLHTAVMNTGTDLRDVIGKGIEKLEASGQATQETTKQAVVDELSRMRTNLREARDRLTASGDMLNTEVRQAVAALQGELRGVREAVNALTPPMPPTPASVAGNGSGPAAHEVKLRPETAEPLTTEGQIPVAAAANTQDAAPQIAATAVIPAQRGSDNADSPLPPAASLEEIRRAVREVLADELASLRSVLEKQPPALLASVGADLRAQLGGVTSALREQLDAAGKEARNELTALREETAALRAELEQNASKEAKAAEVTGEHSALLREAARVSSATVLCHRDVWEFLTAHAGRQPHFRVPAQVLDKGEERVRAALSGRSLIALLIALHSVKETAADGDGDQELATVLYKRVAESLSGLTVTGRPVTITLDDRAPSGELDTPDEAQTNTTTGEQADAGGEDKKE
ncbi:Skp family chaperone for outer membrane proteins [Streptomyces sp. TE3672]